MLLGHRRRDWVHAGLLALGWVVAGALMLAVPAGAVVVRFPDGHQAGVLFRGGVNPTLTKGSTIKPGRVAHARRPEALPADDACTTPDDGNVCWQGGPVLHTVDPYLIFWEPTSVTQIPASSVALLEKYLTDVAAASGTPSDTYGVARQYFDFSGYADQGQTFNAAQQAIVDTDPYPNGACPTEPGFSACVTDPEIQSELTSFIAAHDLPTGTGPNAPIYFVVTPEDTDVCFDASALDGCSDLSLGDEAFCAYHSNFEDVEAYDSQVIYAPIPFSVEQSGEKGCQDDSTVAPQYPNGDFADTMADSLSHESNESITDPIVSPNATGWEDTDADSGNEIADNCESYEPTSDPEEGNSSDAYLPTLGGDATPADPPTWGTLYDQSINGDHYYTQTIWSNGQKACETAPNGGLLSASFTAPAAALVDTAVALNPASTIAAAGVSSATWSFGDGSSSFEPGPAAAVSHTYARPGAYTVTLTVVDEDGQLSRASHTVVIGTPPTASLTERPSAVVTGAAVSFSAAGSYDTNAGGLITFYAWSFGDGATATGPTPVHAYRKAGTYTVTLVVVDGLGFDAARTLTLKVQPPGRITKVSVQVRSRQQYLVVSVSDPGAVRVGSKSVTLHRAGSARFKLGRPRKETKFTVRYSPTLGPKQVLVYTDRR